MTQTTFLPGKVLIAMPGLGDGLFARSLVFLCNHNENGAMGLIVNKLAPMMFFSDLASQLKIAPEGGIAAIPADVLRKPVLLGGPVEQFRGFVLHSSDYHSPDSSQTIGKGLAITAATDVLQALAAGNGPAHAMIALGYSGWVPGQLENEIARNGWLVCDANEELLFGEGVEEKYYAALAQIGVDPLMLSSQSGHA